MKEWNERGVRGAEKNFLKFFEDGVNSPPGGLDFGMKGGVSRAQRSEILCVMGGSGVLGRTPPSTVKRENQIP